MTEPDVTLTDYGLFVECAAFAWAISRGPAHRPALQRWIVLFFLFTALAALLGGTVHGFFNEGGAIGRALWKLSMIAIGGAALAAWGIAAGLLNDPEAASRMVRVAMGASAAYVAVILFVSDAFLVAVAWYLPAAIVLFGAFLRTAVRARTPWAKRGAWGLGLTFVAAAIQQLRIAAHPAYFNHNALYHLVQAVALALIFLACRGWLAAEGSLHADKA